MFIFQMPQSEFEYEKKVENLENRCHFPQCVGAVVDKHVDISSPPGTGAAYRNYKLLFNIILFAFKINK